MTQPGYKGKEGYGPKPKGPCSADTVAAYLAAAPLTGQNMKKGDPPSLLHELRATGMSLKCPGKWLRGEMTVPSEPGGPSQSQQSPADGPGAKEE